MGRSGPDSSQVLTQTSVLVYPAQHMEEFGPKIFAPLVRGCYFFAQVFAAALCVAVAITAAGGILFGIFALIKFHWAFSFLIALPVLFLLIFKWGQKGVRDGKRSVWDY